MIVLELPVLENAVVRLEPLTRAHIPGIADAASGDRASYGWTQVPTPATAADYVADHLAKAQRGELWGFAQVDAVSGRVVGHTSYLTPRRWPDGRLLAIEIGATWLHPDAQGTAINTAAKLLLLGHAFEVLAVRRVDLKTDARNARSRAGSLAIGARFEGILREWQPSGVAGEEGMTRDTAMHSITAVDWPPVRSALEDRLARKAAAPPR